MKIFIIIIAAALFTISAGAQNKRNSTTAYAGEKRVFIYNLYKPSSPAHPDGTATGTRLERQKAGESTWKELFTFASPKSYPEFESCMRNAQAVAFVKSDAPDRLTVWTKYQKCYCLDSVTRYLPEQVYAIAFNVILADTTAQDGNTYVYRVSQVDKEGKVISSYMTNEVVMPATVSFQVPRYALREANPLQVSVWWYTKGDRAIPKALRVFRKRETQDAFELSQASYTIYRSGDTTYYSITDKDISASEMYYYTIAPTTFFGGGSNVRSDTVAITNFNLKDMMLPQLFSAHPAENLIHLSWRTYKPQYLGSIQVFRSTHYDKEYTQVGSASPLDTMYEDRSAKPAVKYYYYLKMTDKLGHQSDRSIKIFGIYYSKRKPRLPFNIRTIASGRGTQIKWNSDAGDISGFYVSRCRGIEGKMEVISHFIPYKDTSGVFMDTAKLNPAFVYGYMVQQKNTSHILSSPSTIAYSQPIIKTVLFAPKELEATLGDKAVNLFWEDMRRLNPAMKAYAIFRKEQGKADFTKLATVPSQNFTFSDSNLTREAAYEYTIAAIDMGNNEGPRSTTAKVIVPGGREVLSPPAGLRAFANENSVELQWSQPGTGKATSYNIYRYQRGSKPVLLSSISQPSLSFTDPNVKKEELYFYYVTSVESNGQESLPCKQVSVRGL